LRVSTDEEPQRRVTKSQQRWSMGTRKLRTIGKLFATQEVPEEDSKEYVPIEVERRFAFPLKGQAIDQNGLKGFRNVETDFTEICRVDDRSDKELLRLYALQLITSKTFKSTMVIAIIINLILMILPITLNPRVDWNNSLTIGDQLRIPLSIIENVIVGLFIVEILLKMFALESTFWYDGWNIFDLFVISALWLSTNTLFFGANTKQAGGSLGAARVLRFIKVLRSMKSIKTLKDSLSGVANVVNTITATIPEIIYLLILMTIFSVLVVIIGYTLFGDAEYMHKHFKDFMEGYYTTYVMLTQDGWVDKFEDGWTNFRNGGSDGNFLIWLIFFLAMIFIFSFIVGAIVVAAVVTNLDNVMIAQSEEELKENEKQDFISGVFDNEDGSSTTEIKREYSIELDYLTDFSIFATTRHKAEKNVLFKCATGKKTSERVEDKLVILEALEKNLIDYNKLRDQFVEIFEEIKQLNDPTTTNEEALRILNSTGAGRMSRAQRQTSRSSKVMRSSVVNKMGSRLNVGGGPMRNSNFADGLTMESLHNFKR